MDFYQHTQNWLDGELFEGTMILFFGVILMIISLLIFRFGTTPNAKVLIIPTLILGLLFTIGIAGMFISNNKRVIVFEESYNNNSKVFIQNKKKRVEDFQILYKYSVIFSAIIFFS